MNRICHIFIVFLSCTSALAQPAQNKQELMRLLQEKPERSAPLLYNYEAPSKIIDTPAPKGFKPFYVSHYGSHGSRYHCTEQKAVRFSTLEALCRARDCQPGDILEYVPED